MSRYYWNIQPYVSECISVSTVAVFVIYIPEEKFLFLLFYYELQYYAAQVLFFSCVTTFTADRFSHWRSSSIGEIEISVCLEQAAMSACSKQIPFLFMA